MKIFAQRNRALNILTEILPEELIRVVRTFNAYAQNNSSYNYTDKENWIVSLDRRRLSAMSGTKDSTTQRWLVIATFLGLVTRLSEEEADGIQEYRHESGIGIQQYRIDKINVNQVRRNWNRWLNGNISFRNISYNKITEVFGAEVANRIYVHPESFEENRELRESRRAQVGIIQRNMDIEEGQEIERTVPTYTISHKETPDEWAERIANAIAPTMFESEEQLGLAIKAYCDSLNAKNSKRIQNLREVNSP